MPKTPKTYRLSDAALYSLDLIKRRLPRATDTEIVEYAIITLQDMLYGNPPGLLPPGLPLGHLSDWHWPLSIERTQKED